MSHNRLEAGPMLHPSRRAPKFRRADILQWVSFAVLLPGVTQFWQPVAAVESITQSGQSDITVQIVVLIIMISALAAFVTRRGIQRLSNLMPLTLLCLFAWAAATLMWSPVPGIGFRRLAFTLFVTLAVLSLANLSDARTVLTRFREVVVGLSLLSIIAIVFTPQLGVHQITGPEPNLAGDWRGVFYHKNIFGAVLAPAILICVYEITTSGRRLLVLMACAAVMMAMLWMTGSKTSTGIVVALSVGLVLAIKADMRKGGMSLFMIGLFGTVAMMSLAVLAWYYSKQGAPLLNDGDFTGRVYIWRNVLAYAHDTIWFGIGYHSVFLVGAESSLSHVFDQTHMRTLAHAHNVYIEMLASIGIVGLTLFLIAFLVAPVITFLSKSKGEDNVRVLCLILILFTLLHGFLEAGLFDRHRPTWIVFLLAYGALRSLPKVPSRSRMQRLHEAG